MFEKMQVLGEYLNGCVYLIICFRRHDFEDIYPV